MRFTGAGLKRNYVRPVQSASLSLIIITNPISTNSSFS